MSSQLSTNDYKVYKHTCPNGKVYIGITHQNPLTRWAGGFGYETQTYFWRAIVKYGWINIQHEILYDNLSEGEAKEMEIRLIKEYNSQDINCGYNIDLGYDHLQSKESRKKRAETKRGKKWSERRRVAHLEYVEHHVGRIVYKYDKDGNLLDIFKNVSLAARDAGVPTETLRTYLHKYVPKSWEYVYTYGEFFKPTFTEYKDRAWNKAAVDMYDMSLNYIRTFKSTADAGRFLGYKGSGHISDVCKGKRLSFKGYIWRYHNENQDNKIA